MTTEKNKIRHITPEQWEEIDRIRDKWTTEYATEQFTAAESRESALAMFKLLDEKPPFIFQVDSPQEAYVFSAALKVLRKHAKLQTDRLRMREVSGRLNKFVHAMSKSTRCDAWLPLADALMQEALIDAGSKSRRLGTATRDSLDSVLNQVDYTLRSNMTSELWHAAVKSASGLGLIEADYSNARATFQAMGEMVSDAFPLAWTHSGNKLWSSSAEYLFQAVETVKPSVVSSNILAKFMVQLEEQLDPWWADSDVNSLYSDYFLHGDNCVDTLASKIRDTFVNKIFEQLGDGHRHPVSQRSLYQHMSGPSDNRRPSHMASQLSINLSHARQVDIAAAHKRSLNLALNVAIYETEVELQEYQASLLANAGLPTSQMLSGRAAKMLYGVNVLAEAMRKRFVNAATIDLSWPVSFRLDDVGFGDGPLGVSGFNRQVESAIAKQVPLRGCVWNHLAAYAAWFEAAKLIGATFDDDRYELFANFCRRCPVWIGDDNAVFILKNPDEIHWDGTVLHNESGPAVSYSKDFGLWVVRGVSVDEQIVMRPETQTLKQIRDERHIERKRIRIERYGWEKYLHEIGAVVIDMADNDIEQTREALMFCVDERLNVLVCSCPSTGDVFALEVPLVIETCKDAQSWLHSGAEIDSLIGTTRVIGRT